MRPYGGELVAYCVDERFYEGFDPTSREDRRLLDLFFELEVRLVECGELQIEHAVLIARA